MICPCKPNCEHKPAHITSEGCGPYHDDCEVFKLWHKKRNAAIHAERSNNLMPNARIPKKNQTVLGTKSYKGD